MAIQVSGTRLKDRNTVEPGPGSSINPETVAGSATPGSTAYAPPAGALFVDPVNGSDGNSGAVTAPLKTFTRAAASVGVNGTIVLRGGSYHEGTVGAGTPAYVGVNLSTAGVTVQSYPGEAVWFDGSSVVTGFVTDTTSVSGRTVYRRDGWVTSFDRSPTFTFGADDAASGGFVDQTNHPAANFTEQVFVDGVQLTQVATLAQVTSGTFYVAGTYTGGTATPSASGQSRWVFTTTTLYVGTNPAGHEVRASDLQNAFGCGAAGIAVKGIGVRRYGSSVAQIGAVKSYRDSCTWENVWIEDIACVGISTQTGTNQSLTNCTILRCGLMGVHSNNADNLVHDRIRVQFCNSEHFNNSPASGNIKVTRQIGYTLKESVISDGYGKGFWADESVYGCAIYTCDIQRNGERGMVTEISGNIVVANCLITDNGAEGFLPFNNTGLRIWNNTLSKNGTQRNILPNNANPRQISVDADNRAPRTAGSVGIDTRYGFPGPYPDMTWEITQIQYKNNVSTAMNGQALIIAADDLRRNAGAARSWTVMGLDFDGNAYARPNTSSPTWVVLTAGTTPSANPIPYTTLAAFQAGTGQDAHSTLLEGGDYLQSDYSINPSFKSGLDAQAVALPTDVADLVGQPAGTKHAGCWR